MTTSSRTTRRATTLAAVVLTAASTLLAGCSGSEGDEAQDPAEVLAEAKQQLDDTPGVRLSLSTEELPEGVDGVLDASGVGTHAPAFEGDIKVLFNGVSVDVPVVAVDGKVYAVIPFAGGGFDEINPDDYGAPDPAGLMDPDTGVANWLTAATEVEEDGQTRDGDQVLTDYTGTLAGEDVASVIPSADETADFPVTFSIDDDGRLVSASVSGPFYGPQGEVDYTLGISDYGTEKDITAP